jgi:hypothetical protein
MESVYNNTVLFRRILSEICSTMTKIVTRVRLLVVVDYHSVKFGIIYWHESCKELLQ